MIVIEGNVCATPAVTSNVAGLRHSVRDGESGLLFEYGDCQGVARAVIRVLTEPRLRAHLARAGKTWGERFSWDRVTDDTLTLIEEAIAPTGHVPVLGASPFAG